MTLLELFSSKTIDLCTSPKFFLPADSSARGEPNLAKCETNERLQFPPRAPEMLAAGCRKDVERVVIRSTQFVPETKYDVSATIQTALYTAEHGVPDFLSCFEFLEFIGVVGVKKCELAQMRMSGILYRNSFNILPSSTGRHSMIEKITLEELIEDIESMEYKLRLLRSKDINLPMTKSPNLAILDELCADAITHTTSMRCRVRNISNSFKSIHRLPLETLSEIFALVPTRESNYGTCRSRSFIRGSGIGPVSHLVPLTEVCHLWRDILHQDPRFWSEVEDRGAQLGAPTFTHYIHRNTTGPLYVRLLSASPSKETRLLLEHSESRIRELEIYNWEQDQSYVPSLLSISADQLRTCKIDYLIDDSKRTTSISKGHAPRLRCLWLTNCMAIPSNAFPSLTNLAIEWLGTAVTDRHFPFAELVAFLKGCPSLREVHLLCGSDVAFQVPPLPDVRSRDLVMPRLRKLSIIGWHAYRDASFHLTLCSRLSLPPDCLLYMTPIPPMRLREVLDVLVAAARQERPLTRLMVTQNINGATLDCLSLQLVDSQNSMGIRVDVQLKGRIQRYVHRGASRRTDPSSESQVVMRGKGVNVLGTAWSTLLHSTFSSLRSLDIVDPCDRDCLRLLSIVLTGAAFEGSITIMEFVNLSKRLAEFVDVFDLHFGGRHVAVKGPLGPEPSPWSSLLPPEWAFWPKWSW
ncbi:hypothetical protein C8Q74DRAFT_1219537 [Fomes fomentarius]|nr:hypothetical protein C8Q74DRAFT_1219537 [Fomes fomentarius]